MIVLKGQPLSTNSIYKAMCRGRFASVYMSRAGKNLKDDYILQLLKQWRQKPILGDTEVHLVMNVYHGTRRKVDIDNFQKLILDSMNGIVYEDDSQIKSLYLEKHYDKENPRVTIEVL